MKIKYKILIFFLFLLSLMATRIIYLPIGNDLFIHQSIQNGYYDYQGVIHFHTQYSGDATGTFEEIAAIANQQKVDFMISTDHNTLEPLVDKKERWYKNTLILTGEEISLSEGYLLAIDIQRLKRFPGGNTEEIISDIVKQGGMIFIAHPNHPKWKWKSKNESGITGEEVLDFADQWYTARPLALLTGLAFYPFNPSAGFLQLYERPAETLKDWDKRTLHRNMVGIFAPDFHQAVRITGSYKIPFPKLERVLPVAHDHVLLKTPFSGNFVEDKKNLYEAIRKGHLYFSMDLLGDPSGFLFSAGQGDQTGWMGDQLPSGTPTTFFVKLPATSFGKETLIQVFHNGEPIFKSGEKEFRFQSSREGAYRIEVESTIPTFWGGTKRVVWIYSNPIYLR